MTLEMTIKRANNGWILEYRGHNCLSYIIVYNDWEKVKEEIEKYFICQFPLSCKDMGEPYNP